MLILKLNLCFRNFSIYLAYSYYNRGLGQCILPQKKKKREGEVKSYMVIRGITKCLNLHTL
jgi:hypothetical protein